MSLRAVEHIFTGATTPIASYDSTKTNLGTLMIQKSGVNPEDNFVGPLPVAIARPMEESTAVAMMFPHAITYSSTIDWVFLLENTANAAKRIFLYEYNKSLATYNWKGFITATTPNATNVNRGFRALRYLHTTGTVAVGAPVSVFATGSVTVTVAGLVTGVGTTFAATHVGMMIGFGSTTVSQINCWYPIVSFANITSINILGASSAYAAGTTFVIASCTVTGTSTLFVTDLVAAGTGATAVAGGLGPRIGFGSTDPTQITTWYHIGQIASNTSINLTTPPGVIPAGTSYVIEELRFAMALTNSTAANGGLFLLKGAGYHDFTTAGSTFPSIATAVDNQRGVYWLCDAGAGAVTNTAASGIAMEAETNKQTHFAYVLDGTNTSTSKFFKYNLRSNNTVAAGKMQLAGANIVITGNQAVTGTIPNQSAQNLILVTASHGPGSGALELYFVTTTRLYCALASGITAASTTFITGADARQEIPPGGVATFPATGAMTNISYISNIDRFIVTNFTSGASIRNYVTRYPSTDTTPFDHMFGVDDKQQDQSIAFSGPIHFNTGAQLLSTDANNGVVHIVRMGASALLNQMYALPFGAHWTYASSTSQRVITPSLDTTGCVKFDQVLVFDNHRIGNGELILPPESFRTYYRTANIGVNATSSWVLVPDDGDISGITAANAIQFMFEFFTIGTLCIPAQLMKATVTYEDGSTDSHYQLSAKLSDITSERFAWRFSSPFGKTVPTLKIELFNATTGSSLLTDTTVASVNGVWEKSINDGSSWTAYNTTDKANEITYIRYSPTALTDGIIIRALLTQN
ncbi:MAG: hypothetical protein NTV02_02660 [Candidatus Zambryskibacteria bacterium]|nr:hypothetical protein [Candidatus Zambryskibacteria bacterium]